MDVRKPWSSADFQDGFGCLIGGGDNVIHPTAAFALRPHKPQPLNGRLVRHPPGTHDGSDASKGVVFGVGAEAEATTISAGTCFPDWSTTPLTRPFWRMILATGRLV